MQDIEKRLQAFTSLLALYQHWETKRDGRAMPARSDIDPVELRQWLGFLNLVDVEEERVCYRYRVFGTSIVRIIGRDMTGLCVHENPPEIAETLIKDYQEVERSATPIFISHEEGFAKGGLFRHHRLLLPFAGESGRVATILVGVFPASAELR